MMMALIGVLSIIFRGCHKPIKENVSTLFGKNEGLPGLNLLAGARNVRKRLSRQHILTRVCVVES